MRWLVRLVTPPGGTVLDPFAGSGTTGEAVIHEHMRAILIEREADYLPLIVARLTKPHAVGFDFGEASPVTAPRPETKRSSAGEPTGQKRYTATTRSGGPMTRGPRYSRRLREDVDGDDAPGFDFGEWPPALLPSCPFCEECTEQPPCTNRRGFDLEGIA